MSYLLPLWTIGLMSGTSLDGIDAALLQTDGITIQQFGPGFTYPYPENFQYKLRSLINNPQNSNRLSIETELTDHHIQAVQKLLAQISIKPALVGFHGQTVFHKPRSSFQSAYTDQIGDGQYLADRLEIDVIYNFRQNDVKNGGEGAPLVPLFHQALAKNLPKPLAIINIGGVSNVTLLDTQNNITASDIGPGNALINDWVLHHCNLPFDEDGKIASQGIIHQNLIDKWLSHPFFDSLLPKSLDRNTFTQCLQDCSSLSAKDGAATLTAFTAQCILKNTKQNQNIIILGGGYHNKFLIDLLKPYLNIINSYVTSWNTDLIEAQAFAYLAVRSKNGLPLSLPSTTGVSQPCTGGQLCVAKTIKTEYKTAKSRELSPLDNT